ELPDDQRAAAERRQREAVQEPGLDVAREVRARVHRREERALDEREREEKSEERVRWEAGDLRRGAEPGGGDREQCRREDERKDDVRGLPGRPQHRAACDVADLRERAHASTSASSSSAPSSERPVFARKTSSRLGACSSRFWSLIPSASSARMIPARSSTPCSSRTATPFPQPP